jgi:hypothetical protein
MPHEKKSYRPAEPVKMKPVSFMVDPEAYAEACELWESQGLTKGTGIRLAIAQYVKRNIGK